LFTVVELAITYLRSGSLECHTRVMAPIFPSKMTEAIYRVDNFSRLKKKETMRRKRCENARIASFYVISRAISILHVNSSRNRDGARRIGIKKKGCRKLRPVRKRIPERDICSPRWTCNLYYDSVPEIILLSSPVRVYISLNRL